VFTWPALAGKCGAGLVLVRYFTTGGVSNV
jgi:hypothetical protein